MSKVYKRKLSKHLRQRASQRGYRVADIDLLTEFGTETEEGYVLTNRDRAAIVQRLDHLVGTAVFERDGCLTTLFRPNKLQLRRMLGRRLT